LREATTPSLIAAARELLRRELAEPCPRQLAGRLARQRVDVDDAARQERRVDAVAQGRDDALARDARRHHEGDQADDAGRVAVALGRHPEGAVDDAFDRVEVEVEVADRAALAGDVDQVVGAAEEAEGLGVDDLEHVGQHRRLRHVTAADGRGGAVAVDAHAVECAPLRAGGRPPRRHLACLGAAVDLEQRCAQVLLGARGELRRQRRRRAHDEGERRQWHAAVEHRLQVERRRHQDARRGDASERGDDVGREERSLRIEDRAAVERDQDARFEAVHVLRRHRRDDGDAGEVDAAERGGETARLGTRVADEQAPRLGVGNRRAGRARRQHVGGDQSGIDRRNGGRCRRCAPARTHGGPSAGHGRRPGLRRARRPRRSARAGAPPSRRRGWAAAGSCGRAAALRRGRRRSVAVDRQVEHRPGARQPLGERRGVGDVLAARARRSADVRERRVEVARGRSGRRQSCEPRSA
jgi:hypothetical protein